MLEIGVENLKKIRALEQSIRDMQKVIKSNEESTPKLLKELSRFYGLEEAILNLQRSEKERDIERKYFPEKAVDSKDFEQAVVDMQESLNCNCSSFTIEIDALVFDKLNEDYIRRRTTVIGHINDPNIGVTETYWYGVKITRKNP